MNIPNRERTSDGTVHGLRGQPRLHWQCSCRRWPPPSPVPTPPPPPAALPAPRPILPFQIVRLDPALDAIVAPDAKLETIATIPGMNGEGPMWYEGRLWVSDQEARLPLRDRHGRQGRDARHRGSAARSIRNWSRNQGPNGLVTDKDGSVLVMRQALRDVARRNRDGSFTPFLPSYNGKKFNAPNDFAFRPDGSLWFTDPTFSLPGVDPANKAGSPPDKQIPFAGVYRYKAGTLTAMITDMELPNGIAFSPDGKTLYVSNTRPALIRAYDVAGDGTLSNQRELIRWQPDPALFGAADGMKVDSKGNLWATGPGGISIITPAGKLLGRIQLPVTSTNVAFGGDLQHVFFTSGPNVYRIRSKVKGVAPLYYRK